MSERDAIDIYLNDHFAGATMAIDLIDRLQREGAGTPLGDFLAGLEPEIKSDRSTLMDVMSKLGIEPDPIKQAAGKIAEVVSRLKLSGLARTKETRRRPEPTDRFFIRPRVAWPGA